MSEREDTIDVLRYVIAADPYHQQFTPLMEAYDDLRQQLTTAERARDEARRERDVAVIDEEMALRYAEKMRHRAKRAERVVEAARAYCESNEAAYERTPEEVKERLREFIASWWPEGDALYETLLEAVRALDAAEGKL